MGNYAKVALVFAQTDPEKKHKGLAAFLVPTDSDGFSSSEIHGKLGLRASDTAELSLDAVEVPDEALLGEIGDGFKVAMSALDSGRFSVAAGCVGICQGCVNASVEYSKQRIQFDRPIASFQLVQEMIADMVVDTEAARALVWRAGWLKDKEQPNTMETSVAKLYATEAAVRSREQRDPGARRLGLRGRLPGRALPARRARHDAVRGHLADPEADHRPRRDRCERDDLMAEPLVVAEVADGVGIARLNRPDARNALSPELMERARRAARGVGRRPGDRLHRDRRQRRVVRGRRRHQGDARPLVPGGARHARPPRSGRGWRPSARR